MRAPKSTEDGPDTGDLLARARHRGAVVRGHRRRIDRLIGRPTLYLVSGDVLDLSGDETLRALGLHLMDRASVMPQELTRGLRGLGARCGTPGTAHDAVSALLLSARRAVEGVSDPLRQVELLDAPRLTETITRETIPELAAIRAPDGRGDATRD